jgi:ribose transport system substrate-binding protein
VLEVSNAKREDAMKRAAAGAAVLVAMIGLFAAGPAQAAGKKSGFNMGFAGFFTGNSWNVQTFTTVQRAAKADPEISNLIVANAETSVEKQIAQLNDMIDKRVDGIVIVAASETAINPTIEAAMKEGIPVVATDHNVKNDKITSQIRVDQVRWGQVTAEWLIEKIGKKGGKIVVLNGAPGNSANNDRWGGAKKVFDAHPEIEILAIANADWDQAKAQPIVATWLAAYPQIDGVWSQGGAMTAAAMIEFEKANRKLVPMVGEAYNGFMKMWIKHLPEGFTSIAPVLPNFDVQIALEVAKRAAKGQKVPRVVNVPLTIIRDDTVKQQVMMDKPDDYWPINWLSPEKVNEIINASLM